MPVSQEITARASCSGGPAPTILAEVRPGIGAARQAWQGGATMIRRSSGVQAEIARRRQRMAKPLGSETLILVTIPVTRTAILISANRIVSNWASRQQEVLVAMPRSVCTSQ